MKSVKSIFNIHAIRNLLNVYVEPGYEIDALDIAFDMFREFGRFSKEQEKELVGVFDSIIRDEEDIFVPDYIKDFFASVRSEIARDYESYRDNHHPGYSVFEKTVRKKYQNIEMIEYAIELGCAPAARFYGNMLSCKGDKPKARYYLSKAVSMGDLLSYHDYADCIMDVDEDDHLLAKRVLMEGAEAGNSECCLLLVEYGLTDNPDGLLQAAKELCNPRYHSVRAKMLFEEEKPKEGFDEYLAGIRDSDSESFVGLGDLYLKGFHSDEFDISPDLSLAISYTEPYVDRFPLAGFVNSKAKIMKGEDLTQAIQTACSVAMYGGSPNTIRTDAALLICSALLGTLGKKQEKTAEEVIEIKPFLELMKELKPGDAEKAKDYMGVVSKIKNKYLKEEA